MAIDPSKLRDEALRLPVQERARLVAELLGSLEHDEDELDEAAHANAWDAELAERLREVDSGEVEVVPWSEARRRIVHEG